MRIQVQDGRVPIEERGDGGHVVIFLLHIIVVGDGTPFPVWREGLLGERRGGCYPQVKM